MLSAYAAVPIQRLQHRKYAVQYNLKYARAWCIAALHTFVCKLRACAQTAGTTSHEPSEAITITVFYGVFVKFIDSLCVSAVCM